METVARATFYQELDILILVTQIYRECVLFSYFLEIMQWIIKSMSNHNIKCTVLLSIARIRYPGSDRKELRPGD